MNLRILRTPIAPLTSLVARPDRNQQRETILSLLRTAGRPMSTADIDQAWPEPLRDEEAERVRWTLKRMARRGEIARVSRGVYALQVAA